MWRSATGAEWSFWDLWFAVLCVRDHGGDWDGLDREIVSRHSRDSSDGERKWSHLLDLRKRLDAASLSAKDLVSAGELAGAVDHKVLGRARTTMFKRSLSENHMSPAMRNPPSARLQERARRGWWPEFPASPGEPYDRLVVLLGLDRGWGFVSDEAYDLTEAVHRLEGHDQARSLAVRRAVLTIGLDLMECCDDSSGELGHVMDGAVDAYVDTDWRSAGIPPGAFWSDFLEIAAQIGNYGIMSGREADIFDRAGVAPDLDEVVGIASALEAEYTAARMSWHAGQVRQLRAAAIVAVGAR
ncbi:MAG: hypothetical protein ACR2G2_03180 [Pseudonocardia sp.]